MKRGRHAPVQGDGGILKTVVSDRFGEELRPQPLPRRNNPDVFIEGIAKHPARVALRAKYDGLGGLSDEQGRISSWMDAGPMLGPTRQINDAVDDIGENGVDA